MASQPKDHTEVRVDSPCVASCQLQAQGFCTGCYRHITEIVYWNKLDHATKLIMLAAQPQRQVLITTSLSSDGMATQACTAISSAVWQATKARSKLPQVALEVERQLAALQQTLPL